MTPEVTRTESDGIDYGWVMQVTFITSIVVGVPTVTLFSAFATLETWPERARFAVGIGAIVWFVIAVGVYFYARQKADED